MTINNPALFVAGLWDWAFLETCFEGTKIKPSDIDGMIEHNGHTLFIETKRPGVDIPKGQDIAFRSWQKDGNTVIVLWGQASQTEAIQVYWPTNETITYKTPCDNAKLINLVSRWFTYARKTNKHEAQL